MKTQTKHKNRNRENPALGTPEIVQSVAGMSVLVPEISPTKPNPVRIRRASQIPRQVFKSLKYGGALASVARYVRFVISLPFKIIPSVTNSNSTAFSPIFTGASISTSAPPDNGSRQKNRAAGWCGRLAENSPKFILSCLECPFLLLLALILGVAVFVGGLMPNARPKRCSRCGNETFTYYSSGPTVSCGACSDYRLIQS
jgi:hypothetical protein